MKLAMLAVLIYPLLVLGFTGASVLLQTALDSLNNSGPHGLSGDPLRLRLGQRQQRLGLRRPERQHALVQHDARHRMLLGRFAYVVPVLALGRLAGGEEEGPGLGRHLPDRRPAVRRPAHRRHRHPLPPAIFPGAGAGADRRALPDARRQDLLIGDSTHVRESQAARPVRPQDHRRRGVDALRKLDPRALAKNPVIFVTEAVSLLVTLLFVRDLATHNGSASFSGQIAAWLWFTVLFANFAEAVAEGRGKAQADALRRTRSDTSAKRYIDPENLGGVVEGRQRARSSPRRRRAGRSRARSFPATARSSKASPRSTNSAITGESAPVIREAGGDRSAVTGGTTVLSDCIKVRITAAPGSTFIDRMIALVEGAERQKTPNELALSILLSGLTLIFLIVCVTLWPLASYSGDRPVGDRPDRAARLSHPDDDRRPSVGDRHRRHGPADPLQRHRHLGPRGRGGGRRRHAAARQDRHDHLRQSHGDRVSCRSTALAIQDLAAAALASSLADETPEGPLDRRARQRRFRPRRAEVRSVARPPSFRSPRRPASRASTSPDRSIRKGAVDFDPSLSQACRSSGAPPEFRQAVERIALSGGTPLAVADGRHGCSASSI